MTPFELQSCPKSYILETHRARPPANTLDVVDGLAETMGVLSLTEASSLDRIGIPVFLCERIRPDGSRTRHTGKGISGAQARVSLLMEAAERYSSEFREEDLPRLVHGSFRSLQRKHPILDPRQLILPAFSDWRPETELNWVRGSDLVTHEEILVPAAAVYHPFHLDGILPFRSHTNGVASGNSIEEAVFHALAEVIERDAWSIAQFSGNLGPALSVENRPDHDFLTRLMETFAAAEVEVVAREVTSDVGVPVIAAFSRDLRYPNLPPFTGFGSHLDPRVALARALLEIAATRAFHLQEHGLDRLQGTLPYHYSEDDLEDPRFCTTMSKPLGEILSSYQTDILEDVTRLLGKLAARGLSRIVAVDLTRPSLNIPTVRVVIAGMEVFCFDRDRRGDRLYTPF